MKDIAKLPSFANKSILVVVAHPDDECLYFYGGLKALAEISTVTVLSVTQSSWTIRGAEIQSFCKSMNLQCAFLNLPDRGIDSTLPDFREDLEQHLSRNHYDLIITHPPHGGEKPHPHHLQTLLTTLSHCLRHQVKFAFFSEHSESICEPTRIASLLRMKLLPLFVLYALRTTMILSWKYKLRWLQILFQIFPKILLTMKSQRKLFLRFEIQFPLAEKKQSLQHYRTQTAVLDSYKTASSNQEYLFFLTGFRVAKNGKSIGTENLLKGYHEFKTSTAFHSPNF